MLDCTRAAHAAIGEKADRLVCPFDIGLIESVLERTRDLVVVLGSDDNIAIEFTDALLPCNGAWVFTGHPCIGCFFVEQGQIEIL